MQLGLSGAPHLTTVVADFQKQGRGRRGNIWHAPPKSCLLFSILLRPDTDPATTWTRIPQIAGMEIIHTVEEHFFACPDIQLKWPNDLYYCDKKWSGILVESKLGKDPFAILGVGINCYGNTTDYPEELQTRITTLEQIFAENGFDSLDLLKSFQQRIDQSLSQFLTDFAPVAAFANRRDYLTGKKLSVLENGESVAGTGAGIDANGELLIDVGGGEARNVIAGTVKVT